MIILNTFLYYILFASIVLIYGIGINKISEFGISKNLNFIFYVKSILTVFATTLISWEITQNILLPLKIIELAPLIIFLVFICLNSFFQAIIMIITGKKSTEFSVTYLIILLAICESCSIINSIIIATACCFALIILMPLCIAFKSRLLQNGQKINEKYFSLFFIFLALLILIASTVDIIWLNPGVLK